MEENKKETKPVEKKEEKKVADKKVETEVKKEEKKTNDKKVTEAKKEEKTKKAEKKQEKDGKKKNNAVIIGIIIVAIVLVALVAGKFLMPESPSKALDNTLNELKVGTYAQNILSGLADGEDEVNAEMQKLFFEKLEWKILGVQEEGDKATVEIEIKNKDFKTIIGNYMQKALKAAFSGQNISEEEMTNYLMEELRNEETQIVTNNQSIVLQKQDGKWDVAEEENFVNAVLPGLYEAMNSFNQQQ